MFLLDLLSQKMTLPLTGVLLQCLDERGEPISNAYASGFIRNEEHALFLYTCWHVVTGFDPHDIQIGRKPPHHRRFLRVKLQDALPYGDDQNGMTIGGHQTIDVPLYEQIDGRPNPVWLQDEEFIDNADLAAVNIKVPALHDVVKIQLSSKLRSSDIQLIAEHRLYRGVPDVLLPGDKVFVVGYPHGFSALGAAQPAPIVLTRFIAARQVEGRPQQFLLESIGSKGMSGGPVFVERSDLLLAGIYTGSIFPDYAKPQREAATALGTVCSLELILNGKSRMTHHLPGER